MEKIGGNSMLSSEQRLSRVVVSALSLWPGGWPESRKPPGAAVILHHKARGRSRQMLLTLILLFLNKPKGVKTSCCHFSWRVCRQGACGSHETLHCPSAIPWRLP